MWELLILQIFGISESTKWISLTKMMNLNTILSLI